jgi:hypothetical protein
MAPAWLKFDEIIVPSDDRAIGLPTAGDVRPSILDLRDVQQVIEPADT